MGRSLQARRPGAGRAVVGARAALGPRVLSAGVKVGMPWGGAGPPRGALRGSAAWHELASGLASLLCGLGQVT